MGQVLWVVFKELSGGSRTVGQLQFLEFLQLNEAWQTIGGQQGAAWGGYKPHIVFKYKSCVIYGLTAITISEGDIH